MSIITLTDSDAIHYALFHNHVRAQLRLNGLPTDFDKLVKRKKVSGVTLEVDLHYVVREIETEARKWVTESFATPDPWERRHFLNDLSIALLNEDRVPAEILDMLQQRHEAAYTDQYETEMNA